MYSCIKYVIYNTRYTLFMEHKWTHSLFWSSVICVCQINKVYGISSYNQFVKTLNENVSTSVTN